jgi:DNA-binding NarL/FixJ family response regulator
VDKIRLLVVEDQSLVREALRALLSYRSEFEVMAAVSNGREAMEQFRRDRPDVVLMDLQMPEMDGLSTTRALLREDPACKVLILTTYEGDEDVYKALAAGARGYLLKECPPDELFAAIRKVASGEGHVSKPAAESLASRAEGAGALSDREIEVVRLMAKGLSNREIADRLFVSEATVRTHANHIFTKLGVSDRLEAVMVASRRGFIRL